MRKEKLYILFLFLGISCSLPLISLAQELSPEPTSTDQTDQEIQEIRDAVKKKVQEKIDQITTSAGLNEKRAWYGVVQSVEEGEIKIKSRQDKTRTLRFDQDTSFIDLKRQDIDSSVLKPDQQILAMGIVLQEDILETKRLLLIPTPTDWSQTKVVYAKISDISTTSEVLVLTPLQNKNEQYEVKISPQTKSETSFADFETGQKIVAVLTQSENGKLTYTARHLKIIEDSPTPTPELQDSEG
jgi:multidrug efflux pump subunit AcrB